jgi:hypothetical protein
MIVTDDGAEINSAIDLEVYGDWIKFTDGEGAVVKIPPSVVNTLMIFAINNFENFDEGAWQ